MTILNNILAVAVREFRVMCTRYSILMVLSGGIFYTAYYIIICMPPMWYAMHRWLWSI